MFSREILQNIEIRRHFNSLAFSHAKTISQCYDEKVSGFDDLFESVIPKCLECMIAAINDAVSVLSDNGVYDYDRSAFFGRPQGV